jgi:hypothetical protein
MATCYADNLKSKKLKLLICVRARERNILYNRQLQVPVGKELVLCVRLHALLLKYYISKCLVNVGASTSHKPMVLHGLLHELLGL